MFALGALKSRVDAGFESRDIMDLYMRDLVENQSAFRSAHGFMSRVPDGKYRANVVLRTFLTKELFYMRTSAYSHNGKLPHNKSPTWQKPFQLGYWNFKNT